VDGSDTLDVGVEVRSSGCKPSSFFSRSFSSLREAHSLNAFWSWFSRSLGSIITVFFIKYEEGYKNVLLPSFMLSSRLTGDNMTKMRLRKRLREVSRGRRYSVSNNVDHSFNDLG